ncbi:AAA family ATPase, partial [Candidatus Marithioploca araucensis]|nr:AAA family ATPase [Candidatus Marithioploca araucensis]
MCLEDFGGESLKYWLAERSFRLDELLKLAIRATEILGGIHKQHIIHKDINPTNLVFNPTTGVLKVIDFGISTQLSRQVMTLKNPNILEGTLAYMSPEQTGRMNRALDYRTDFYSLGVTFYELFTGQLPFKSTDAMKLVHCHIAKQPTPPVEVNPDVPTAISNLIMKLLEKTAEARYQSTWGIKTDLENCLNQFSQNGSIEIFQLANADISDRFQIPQKLYGRDHEIETLLAAFERVSQTSEVSKTLEVFRDGSQTSEVSKTSEVFRDGSQTSEVSKTSEVSCDSQTSEVSKTSEVSCDSQTSEVSKTSEVSCDSQTSEVSKTSEVFRENIYKSEIMLVAGFSGIGKSVLVKEIYKSLTEKQGYFISGKFDQFQRNIPYSAVVTAFGELVQQLLTESESQLIQWKDKLLTALSANGQLIIDILPEIELIIGSQPAVPKLGMTESKNRFNLVFQNFMRVFCQPEHPLVIFLDDLQWVDSATLNLLEVVMTDKDTNALFFIGVFRDNEVTSTHPLMMALDALSKENVVINKIVLKPLVYEDVNLLIADSLHKKSVESLTDLVMRKTKGNPFFVNQFLHTLYDEDLLHFVPPTDEKKGGWQWNIDKIEALNITDNVVDLMIAKLKKLPESTQQVLRLAACVGNHFDLETLSVIYEKSVAETFQDLQPALNEG